MALLSAGHGIYFVTSPEEAALRVRLINGCKCTRFMDRIYLPAPTHKLSEEQVVVVNMLRHRFRKVLDLSENIRVRALMQAVVARSAPMSVLEVGAGFFPLFSPHELFEFTCLDLNEAAVISLRGKGYSAFVFSGVDRLTLSDHSMDIVVAVFVLHFAVSDVQFAEINRVLKDDGLFVANVYRRSKRALVELRSQLERAGLSIAVVADPASSRRAHYFWIAARTASAAERGAETVRTILS